MVDPIIASLSELEKTSLGQAKIECDAYLKSYPHHAALWHYAGLLSIKTGDLQQAKQCLEESIRLDANDPKTFNHLGNTCRMMGDVSGAAKQYHAALTLDPYFAESHNNLGNLAYREKNYATARTCYERALAIAPEYGDAHSNMAHVLCQLELYGEAIEHFMQAVQYQPENPRTHYNYAVVLRHLGQKQQAIKEFWECLQREPNHLDALFLMAECYSELQQSAEAITAYEQLLTIAPHHPQANHNLATLFHKEGRYDKALQYYHRALIADPKNEIAEYLYHALLGEGEHRAAPKRYLSHLFDQYAGHYEQHLQMELCYQGPSQLKKCFELVRDPHHEYITLLDMGCGTGLVGEALNQIPYKIGVDLSLEMVKLAQAKHVYHDVIATDIETYLRTTPQLFDLMVALEVWIYFGDLESQLGLVSAHLNRKGLLFFTLEALDEAALDADYVLCKTGRYQHHSRYIEAACEKAGLKIIYMQQQQLRMHEMKPVRSWFVVATVNPG